MVYKYLKHVNLRKNNCVLGCTIETMLKFKNKYSPSNNVFLHWEAFAQLIQTWARIKATRQTLTFPITSTMQTSKYTEACINRTKEVRRNCRNLQTLQLSLKLRRNPSVDWGFSLQLRYSEKHLGLGSIRPIFECGSLTLFSVCIPTCQWGKC